MSPTYKNFLILCLLLSKSIGLHSSNPSKYVIGHWRRGGLGICLSSALNHLLYCEARNLTPVIYWHKSLYHNPCGFNDKTNEWEYYFNQVSSLQYKRGDTINYYCTGQGCGSFNYYDVSQEKRELAHRLICKYITLNDIVQRKVSQFYNKYMLNKRTIGIHMRGTDKYTEEKPVAPETVVAEALKHADDDTQFFIATDEKKLFIRMAELLKGRKVIYYDCYRSPDGRPLHYRNKPAFSQLGEDVVVEMWLMARCDILIHTLSNVSSIPLYVNPNLVHVTLSKQ